jgi:hypothetical protein
MDIEKIIEDVGKYHYVGCGDKKCKIMASSDSKSEAKKKAKKFLEPYINDLVGSSIYLVKIKRSTKEEWDKNKHILLPGPIYMEITEYIVQKKKKLKESSKKFYQKVFFSEKYLKKNNNIKKSDITDLVMKHEKDQLKTGLMEANII